MCVLVCFIYTFNLFMCLIIKQLQLYFAFCFVSLRFFASFRFRLQRFKLTNKIAFLGRFLPFSSLLLPFVCGLSVPTQKAVILTAFARQFFDTPPAPKRPPPRPRLPFRIIFFEFFFSIYFPFCTFPRFFFIFFYFFQHRHLCFI